MRKGLAASTIKCYDFAWNIFSMFCLSVSVPLKPVSINTVCAFICYCMDVRHFKPQYIRGLIAGIQFNVRCFDPSFPSLFGNPAIKILLKGISKSAPLAPDSRQPITLSILHKMLSVIRNGVFSPYVDALLESVFLLAFYACLRSGEFTTASQAFDPDRDVSYSDLVFHPHYYSLRLRHSKRGGPCSVIVARIDSSFCPFRAMVKYIRIRPITAPLSPLFITSGNLPLTKNWFCSHLRQVLIKSNLSPQNYSGHSFRIGSATSAANQGFSPASLQQLGRWSSSAYSSYIRLDVDSVLANQRSLKP